MPWLMLNEYVKVRRHASTKADFIAHIILEKMPHAAE
jgi:hypothetical protein